MRDADAAVFSAMSDATRRSILRILSDHDALPVGELADRFPEMTRAAVSAHLRVLRSADMVTEERRGQFRYYRLGPNRAESVVDFLRSVYEQSLEDLVERTSSGDG